MREERSNFFLNHVCKKVREKRESIHPPEWNIPFESKEYTEIWVPTDGCRWDKQGYCTQCNYESPLKAEPEAMVFAVKKALSKIKITPSRLLISSYSILDGKEIPAETRQEIFEMLAKTDVPNILCETRPETVTLSVLKECKDILGEKNFEVEIGIESMNSFIRKWCINKGLKKSTIKNALDAIHAVGATSFVNLIIGAPFLSTQEIISDVESSIHSAIDLGADNIVLFPVHVKPHTLVEWLYCRKLYTLQSLWTLVEIMNDMDQSILPSIYYSWIEPKISLGLTEFYSPTTCRKCHHAITQLLSQYLFSRSKESLNSLFQYKCECRDLWRSNLEKFTSVKLIDRMTEIFPIIGRDILGNDWWNENGTRLLQDLNDSWKEEGQDTESQ